MMYLIWSGEHRQWWKPNSMGYTSEVHEAGWYSEYDAYKIEEQSRLRGLYRNYVVPSYPLKHWMIDHVPKEAREGIGR